MPHILVVEDEYLIALDAERVLTDAGCSVEIASYRQFRDALNRYFDVILLDTTPAIDDVLSALELASQSGSRLVLVTTDAEDAAAIPGAAGHTILLKPYDESALTGIV